MTGGCQLISLTIHIIRFIPALFHIVWSLHSTMAKWMTSNWHCVAKFTAPDMYIYRNKLGPNSCHSSWQNPNPPVAQLVGVFAESIFYGIYLVTFFASLRYLFFRCPVAGRWTRRSNDRTMLIIALLLFVFGTLLNLVTWICSHSPSIHQQCPCWRWCSWAAWPRLGQYSQGTTLLDLSLFLLSFTSHDLCQPLTVNIQGTVADYAIVRSSMFFSRLLLTTEL